MKSVMRMRHYCDHCKKATGTKPAMVKHEKGCTANPSRICGLCEKLGEVQLPMDELQAAYAKGFNALRAACHDCPACILATQRIYSAGLESDDFTSWDSPRNTECGEWTFKEAMKKFWAEYNAEHRQDPEYF